MASKPFLGSGLSFPLRIGGNGDFIISQELEQIDESIVVILGTKIGERRAQPEFGSNLHLLMFENGDPATLALCQRYTAEAIQKWEPRVNVNEVSPQLFESPSGLLGINILINYVVIKFNVENNLVYPFYLQREEG